MALYLAITEGSKAKVERKSLSHYLVSWFGDFPGQKKSPDLTPYTRTLFVRIGTDSCIPDTARLVG
jgi:hypothetical protein